MSRVPQRAHKSVHFVSSMDGRDDAELQDLLSDKVASRFKVNSFTEVNNYQIIRNVLEMSDVLIIVRETNQ